MYSLSTLLHPIATTVTNFSRIDFQEMHQLACSNLGCTKSDLNSGIVYLSID